MCRIWFFQKSKLLMKFHKIKIILQRTAFHGTMHFFSSFWANWAINMLNFLLNWAIVLLNWAIILLNWAIILLNWAIVLQICIAAVVSNRPLFSYAVKLRPVGNNQMVFIFVQNKSFILIDQEREGGGQVARRVCRSTKPGRNGTALHQAGERARQAWALIGWKTLQAVSWLEDCLRDWES